MIPNDGTQAPVNPFFARFDASGATLSPVAQFIGSGGSKQDAEQNAASKLLKNENIS